MRTHTPTHLAITIAAGLTLCLAASAARADIVPVDADFEGATVSIASGAGTNLKGLDKGWYTHDNNQYSGNQLWRVDDLDSDGNDEAYAGTVPEGALVQSFTNAYADGAGSYVLEFDYVCSASGFNLYYDVTGADLTKGNTVSYTLGVNHGDLLAQSVPYTAIPGFTEGDAVPVGSGTLSLPFDVTQAGGYNMYAVRFFATSVSGDADGLSIDNVRIGVIPEPASMALLGLGALCFARRRRSE